MKTPFSGGRPRLLSYGRIGIMDAATGWTFVFTVSALVCAGPLSQRVAAADPVLSDAQMQSWFDYDLKDGAKNVVPVRHNCRADEYIDGTAYFGKVASRLRSVSGTGSYIYLLNWWIDDTIPLDSSGLTLRGLLELASWHQVQIRGLFWDAWLNKVNKQAVQDINQLQNGGAALDSKTLKYGSHHQKLLIIYDATTQELVAFCGGIDFNRDRLYANGDRGATQEGGPDHDVQVMLHGPAAWDLLYNFRMRWWDNADVAALPTTPDDKRGLWGQNSPNIGTTVSSLYKAWVQIGHTFPPPPPPSSLWYSSWYYFAPHGEQSARGMILHAIANAKKYIYLEDQFLVSPEASEALHNALVTNTALQLIILIPKWEITLGGKALQRYRHAFLAPLKTDSRTRNRVHVFIRTGNPRGTDQHTYIHSKIWIFDDEFAIIGSACCNNRSWTYDSEIVAGICDPGNGANLRFAHRLRVELWQEHLNATAAELDDWWSGFKDWTVLAPPGNHIAPYDDSSPWQPIDGFQNSLVGSGWGSWGDPDAGKLPLH
jgi:phosphatidylserine/phosphatidylglycerophosphate/cardiolipin synthase-like enzyme